MDLSSWIHYLLWLRDTVTHTLLEGEVIDYRVLQVCFATFPCNRSNFDVLSNFCKFTLQYLTFSTTFSEKCVQNVSFITSFVTALAIGQLGCQSLSEDFFVSWDFGWSFRCLSNCSSINFPHGGNMESLCFVLFVRTLLTTIKSTHFTWYLI